MQGLAPKAAHRGGTLGNIAATYRPAGDLRPPRAAEKRAMLWNTAPGSGPRAIRLAMAPEAGQLGNAWPKKKALR